VIAALRYEWVRLTTVRSTWICLVLTFVGVGGIAYLASSPGVAFDETGNLVGELPFGSSQWYLAFSAPLLLTAILASVVAAQCIGQEYRFGLIRLTLTAFPNRLQVLGAKLASVVVVGVAFALTSYAASWVALVLRGHPTPPTPADVPVDSTLLLRGVLLVVLWALSAFALAGITRQTALGIAVPIVSGVVVEQIIGAVLRERASWVGDILPWSSAGRWAESALVASGPDGMIDPQVHLPPVGWGALGVFAVWVVVFLVLEAAAFLRRDA
jgi:ABC-type transport system involved in multi-copper enzyme maturation permease subunit